MIVLALIVGAVLLFLSAYLMVKALKSLGKTINYDKSTELLIKQRDIKRSAISRGAKAVRLNELDIEIDSHLNGVEIDTARQLARS